MDIEAEFGAGSKNYEVVIFRGASTMRKNICVLVCFVLILVFFGAASLRFCVKWEKKLPRNDVDISPELSWSDDQVMEQYGADAEKGKLYANKAIYYRFFGVDVILKRLKFI